MLAECPKYSQGKEKRRVHVRDLRKIHEMRSLLEVYWYLYAYATLKLLGPSLSRSQTKSQRHKFSTGLRVTFTLLMIAANLSLWRPTHVVWMVGDRHISRSRCYNDTQISIFGDEKGDNATLPQNCECNKYRSHLIANSV